MGQHDEQRDRAEADNRGRVHAEDLRREVPRVRRRRDEEDHESATRDDRRHPGHHPYRLTQPELTKHERDDEFSDEYRLHHREWAEVQRQRLKDERATEREPSE